MWEEEVWCCLFLFIAHSHLIPLRLVDKDINFVLAVVVFVQQISAHLIHYSPSIVERALLLNGISGDDLITYD